MGNPGITRLGGLTNTNLLITFGDERYVLRVGGRNAQRLGVQRDCEMTALRCAADAGLAPEVIEFLLPEGHLLTRWVDGRQWDVREFRTPANVRLLTQAVKRIHALPANGATFSPFRRVEEYLRTIQDFHGELPENLTAGLETMRIVEAGQARDSSGWLRMCHNDLASVNYLYNEQEHNLCFLDWEFAGLGDIYYDLAGIVYTHDSDGPIPSELEDVMLACYFGEVSDLHRERLAGMKYMLMLFTGCWALAQHAMLQAGLVPAVEGFDYLEFARYLFTHDIYDLQRNLP